MTCCIDSKTPPTTITSVLLEFLSRPLSHSINHPSQLLSMVSREGLHFHQTRPESPSPTFWGASRRNCRTAQRSQLSPAANSGHRSRCLPFFFSVLHSRPSLLSFLPLCPFQTFTVIQRGGIHIEMAKKQSILTRAHPISCWGRETGTHCLHALL